MITICLILLQKSLQQPKAEERGVLFLFTGSTHGDSGPTTKKFEKYLFVLFCWIILLVEHLMKKAKKEGWFDNTIFIFMAALIVEIGSFLRNDSIEERFKIPFVIYAPKILKLKKIDYIVS